jgi:hypothetical protein
MVMKQVTLGDRMMDTTVQMLLSTIIGGILSGLTMLYTKGLWREWAVKWTLLWNKKAYNPIEFNPSLASCKPANDKHFIYKSIEQAEPNIIAWFYMYHKKTLYNHDNKRERQFPATYEQETITKCGVAAYNTYRNNDFETFTPIWRDQNGYYVYLKSVATVGGGNSMRLYSDSGEALENCALHIKNFIEVREPKKVDPRRAFLYTLTRTLERTLVSEISKNKTFKTLFFEQKESVLPVLTAFKEKRLYPKHLPLDNKVGILLHGPPGTGKTGFISALANFLERDILYVHMSQIRTRANLDVLFKFANSNYIFVFEEFDCMPGVKNRAFEKKQEESKPADASPYAMMLMAQKGVSDKLMNEYKQEQEEARDKLDLGYLLSKLDGLESAEDRIIVATTNYPERIDPALLRPGRFGLKIHLRNATRKMIAEILEMAYQLPAEKMEDLTKKVECISDYKWSPAQILQMVMSHPSYEEVTEILATTEPKDF